MSNPLLAQLSDALASQSSENTVIELPENAPFDNEQRNWLNGLLTGINAIAAAAQSPSEAPVGTPLSILYGSQSGNAEVLSKDMKKFAATQGFDATIAELDSIELTDLAQIEHAVIICSTFGEGEPPDNAKKFYGSVMADDAPSLPSTFNFSVCGLGDSSYPDFNKCALDINSRLVALGANECAPIMQCDAAFEDEYAEWKQAVFSTEVFTSAAGGVTQAEPSVETDPTYTKNHPFIANQICVEQLSHPDSAKCVNHIELSLAGGGEDMHYDVGDALGVWPLNCPKEVADILAAGQFTGKEVVAQKNGSATLKTLLLSKLDIATVNAKALETWGIADVPEGFQVFDVLNQLKPNLDAQTLVDGLRPLQPRLYSIASSPKAHPGEVHLTVGEVHYDLQGKARKGVASTWLGQRLQEGANVGVYVQASAHFHIPADDDAPLIMIGPGTGIAPFRAFLEEREMRQAQGPNWLFFGDQHEQKDYLYQDQITAWQTSGLLNNLSLAWSRDTDRKIYVQTLIEEQGAEFFAWLEQGAYIYICGDASRMASDVDKAIRDVIAKHGNVSAEDADAYMDKLVAEHRYQRDVY